MKEKIKEKYSIEQFNSEFSAILTQISQTKTNPKVIIQGGYGKRNTGDDALLMVIYDRVKSIVPDSEIIILCHYPDEIRKVFGWDAFHFSSSQGIQHVLTCDLLIIGGGGIVNKINTFSGYQKLKIFDPKGKFLFLTSLITKIRRKPVVFYVVGMTSIPDKVVEFLMKSVLGRVDLIAVRDELSQHNLKNLGIKKAVSVVHDPAVDLKACSICNPRELLKNEGVNPDKKLVGLNLRLVSDEEVNKNTIQVFSDYINHMAKQNPEYHFVFFPIGRHQEKRLENDFVVGEEIAGNLTGENFTLLKDIYKPDQVKSLLSSMDVLILTRLHAVILSFEYNIPTLIVTYDDKVTQFAKMIEKEKSLIKLEDININSLLSFDLLK